MQRRLLMWTQARDGALRYSEHNRSRQSRAEHNTSEHDTSMHPVASHCTPLHPIASQARWAPLLHTATVAGAPWVQRELAWHAHVLLAGVSFDSHMNESVIDQGTAYRYYAGKYAHIHTHPCAHVHSLPLLRMHRCAHVRMYVCTHTQPAHARPCGDACVHVAFASPYHDVVHAHARAQASRAPCVTLCSICCRSSRRVPIWRAPSFD